MTLFDFVKNIFSRSHPPDTQKNEGATAPPTLSETPLTTAAISSCSSSPELSPIEPEKAPELNEPEMTPPPIVVDAISGTDKSRENVSEEGATEKPGKGSPVQGPDQPTPPLTAPNPAGVTSIPQDINKISPPQDPGETSRKIWLVESEKENMNKECLQVIETLGLEAVGVHSKNFYRQSFGEKIQKHPEIRFAIVLLSGNDFAYAKDSKPSLARLRACQQTVYELGFLLAKLGRQNTFIIYYEHQHFSLPTDLLDAIYVPYNLAGDWRHMLVTRLRLCGLTIDDQLAQKVTVEKNR